MRSGHSLIGGHYTATNDSIYASFYYMETGRMVKGRKPVAAGGAPETALSIGLGIGVSANSLIRHGLDVDVAEIDPVVYQYARDYFGLPEPRRVFIDDGRRVLERAEDASYDYVLHDVFTGGSVPKQLFSLEALQEIRRVLKPDGVLTLNYVGMFNGSEARATWSVWRTLREVFPHVASYKQAPEVTDGIINAVFIASALPIELRDWEEGDYLDGDMRYFAFTKMAECKLADPDANMLATASVVTDANNPLDTWQWLTASEHWKTMRSVLPLTFWLNY
ncbi:S-adenosyl-L-methionine-dependent methyltransferase [Thamnocephalis sphaerospora]|uniref:S-adenosyl-L-methionine-dependent methyltransferase n=1 Tax=Thamnocephalis sphaerospora TaxID=78915 RepID=A0A4P9XMU1_9FUNG|nr:S-adenosyl-L-methionine-dependent methyltransferase [Thamnocephalis sphaerospora]|eukprot:RKP06711.1 S-adenosyl-L-methionine-dependent methyltransferase [Thamnocephalis sphaerospora]